MNNGDSFSAWEEFDIPFIDSLLYEYVDNDGPEFLELCNGDTDYYVLKKNIAYISTGSRKLC